MKKKYFEKFKYVAALGAYRKGNITWAADCFTNSLYKINEKTKEIDFVINMETNSEYMEAEYAFIEEHNDILFMLPQNSYFLCAYDSKRKELKKIELPCKKNRFGYGAVGGVIYQDNLFIFSCFAKYAPYKINLIHLEVEEEKDWHIELQKLNFSGGQYLLHSVAFKKNQIIFGLYDTNAVMAYSLKNKKFRKICSLKEDFKIEKIISINVSDTYVFAVDHNKICKVNLSDNSQKIVYIDFWKKGNSVIHVLFKEDIIYLLPKFGCEIIKYNFSEDKIEKLEWNYKEFTRKNQNKERFFFNGYIWGEKLFLYLYKQRGRISIDLNTGNMEFEDLDKDKGKDGIEIFEKDYWRQLKSCFKNYYETMCPLKIYVNQPFSQSAVSIKKNNLIGKEIWNELRKD